MRRNILGLKSLVSLPNSLWCWCGFGI